MRSGRQWAGHIAALLVGTGKTWWACLPMLFTLQLLTTLGSQLLRLLAALVSQVQPWIAIFLIAGSFVVLLSGIVISLRIAGDYLDVDETLPQPQSARQQPMGELLAVTLLPFLGIYASFGVVESATRDVVINSYLLAGGVGGTTLNTLDPRTRTQYLVVAAAVVGSYLLRRLIERIHERTRIRALGLAAAFVEAFFMLSLLVAGMRLVLRAWYWLGNRQFMTWLTNAGYAFAAPFRLLRIDLPEIVTQAWDWITTTGWPTLLEIFAEPVLWLAMTSLVIGTGVLSIGDLWRRRETPQLLSSSQRRSARRVAHRLRTSSRLRGGLLAFQDAFLGDIDDKYLPTWQSLKLILRVGPTFLGAYLVVYSALALGERLTEYGIKVMMGGNSIVFWGAFIPVLDLIQRLLVEPLRVCLLAVAFQRASTWSPPAPNRAIDLDLPTPEVTQ